MDAVQAFSKHTESKSYQCNKDSFLCADILQCKMHQAALHVVIDLKMLDLYRSLFKGHDRDLSGGGLQPVQQYASYLE